MAGKQSAVDDLTEREQEILVCLAEGLSNQEIANRLHLAEKTVRWYNSQIYSKLGVSNRKEAVAQARVQGLLAASALLEDAAETHKLPAQATAFVGRRAELDHLSKLLDDPDTRLVTILAPGGMGKTRLAIEAARSQIGRFADGVCFVPLAPVSSSDSIVAAIAEALGFSFSGGVTPKQQLLDFLQGRAVLLLLDNFEHLLAGVSLVAEIIGVASSVTVLATSREKLNLTVETIFSLSGLHFPAWETPEDALQYDAVQLFMQSAQRVRPSFELRTEDLDFLARICRLTEGMPLGIVLAAGWIDVLSLEQIVAEIQQGIDILETELHDVPERQRSIRASFNYTWARLTEAEREVFMKLSVFRGGFTADAAQAVAGANPRHLRKLVDKALVQAAASERYDMHELLRQYAEAQLEAAGQADLLRDAYARYISMLFYTRRSDQYGRRKGDLLRTLNAEVDNIRASWGWAVQRGLYDVIDQLVDFLWIYFTDYSEAFELGAMCQAAVDVLADGQSQEEQALLGRVLARQGKSAASHGHFARAEALLRQSMAIAREQEDLEEYHYAQRWLARYVLLFTEDDPMPILHMLEDCAAYYREQGDKYFLALTLGNMATLWRKLGELNQMRVCLIEAYQLNQALDFPHGIAETLWYLGFLETDEGNWAEAESHFAASLDLTTQMSSQFVMPLHSKIAFVILMQGRLAQAEQLCNAGLAMRQSLDSTTLIEYSATTTAKMTQSLIADARAAPEEALALIDEVRAMVQRRGERVWLADLIYVWALSGLAQFDVAFDHLTALFRANIHAQLPISEALLLIATAVRLFNEFEQAEQAVELLGLVYTHPNGPRGYLEQHQGMTRLRRDLEAEVGAEAYAAAWAKGQSGDVGECIDYVLEAIIGLNA